MSQFEQIEILLVEDNPEDAEMTMRALRKRNLANQLHWVKDGAEARAIHKGPEAVIDLGELPPALGDSTVIRHVWSNLLGNALKFSATRSPPRISISGRIEGGQTLYAVQDNGVGFDMRYADKLFGVFQRLHRQEDFPGTGIGLANVKRVLDRHGGRIWAEAEVGKGATFYFWLPS